MSEALRGVRVLDAATNIAGPYAASVLADLGAETIKLEPLGGDPMRAYPPFVEGRQTQYAAVNHGKRHLAADLRTEPGRELLGRALRESDVVIQNLRPGRERRLGLDAAACHEINPRLVHASVAAFHPAAGDRPGYDLLIQGESGLMDQTGEPDRAPSRIGAAAIDYTTGLWLAIGILAELRGERARPALRVSLLDVALGLLNDKASAYLATGELPRRMGSGTSVTTPHGAFATADGYIVIGAATDRSFALLAQLLGPPLDDERYLTQAGRLERRRELEALIDEKLGEAGTEHWLALLGDAGVPVGRVSDLGEAVERHRRDSATGLRAIDGVEAFSVLAPPLSFDGEEWGSLPAPGRPGEDTDEVLAQLGLSAAEIGRLREAGVVE